MILRLEQYLARVAGGTGVIPENPETNTETYLAILAGENRQAPEPVTRLDMYLYNLVGGNYPIPTPNTRIEQYLAKACGLEIEVPTPITREEQLWYAIANPSWQLTTLTGALPLSFKSKGEALTDYKIYGTSDGAGAKTESGEPTGYKLPMIVTSEEESTTTPIYIGDGKLGAEEYVDYGSGKVYKLKEVHKDTVTINGIEWDILGYDHDTVYKSDNTLAQHSVTIQTHDCISEVQFDAREALFAFPEGLVAGTYHFTVSQQPWYAGDVGKTMQFTLTNAIPADGVIVLDNAYNATMIGSTISVYASCSATTATETATISEGNDGTDLGSVGNAISGNTNSIQRALLGSNNYNESAIRQYLNSDGTAGTYWTPQTKWDRPPYWAAFTAGFLRGFNSNFASAIGKASKRTAKNTVSDGGGYIDTEEKIFLPSRTEVYAGDNNSISEGRIYKYYSDYSDLSSAGTGADSNRIKYRNNVAKYWWLRSPHAGYASGPFNVDPLGDVYGRSSATDVYGVAPACCIILDDINTNPYLQSLFLKPTDPPVALPELSTYEGVNVISFDDGVVRTADSNPEHPQLQADLSLPTKQSNVLYFFREFANVTDSTASQREVYVITKSILPKLDYINIHFWENGSIVKTIKTTLWYTGQNIDGMRPMFPPEGYCFIIVTLNKVPINRFPFQSTIEMIYKEAGNG